MSDEVYEGRLVADGKGNLLADEGDRAGDPVAYNDDDDNFIFISWDEPSHNERFHLQHSEMTVIQDQDPDAPGYAGTADEPTEGNEHHFTEPQGAPGRELPDHVSAKASSHTHQHKVGK